MTHIAHNLLEERTQDIEIDEDVAFSDLLLSEPVLAGLHAAGFRRPSPIQLAAIPLGRCGLDLVVQAKSGTGKTCVLAVVALEAVTAASPATQALVVAPTREVAVQVAQVVSTLASAMPGLNTAAFIGGTKVAEDKAKLKQCQVVVGTPGRLAQLVSLGHLNLEHVRLLVLDEADRLLEGNLHTTIMDLIKFLPFNKQVLCLSATYSNSAAAQAESLMRSPSHVRLGRESPALLGVNQVVRRLPAKPSLHLRQAAKEEELLLLLSQITFNQCLVFSGSQLRAESVCHRLMAKGWPATHLTAALSQTERLAALEALCSHQCRVLVATDLAARGLDSAHVNLVVNLDLPPDPATYLHRAGRAGRYGSRGAAITLVCGPEEWYGVRAIATLANVTLLLAGGEWVSSLATHKVEGWKRPETEKIEDGEENPEKEMARSVAKENGGENNEDRVEGKEMEENLKQRKEARYNEGKKEVEKAERVEKGGTAKLSNQQGLVRLEEVEYMPEEEARAWLKAHRPGRRDEGRGKQAQSENGVQEMGDRKKVVVGGNVSLRSEVESEGRNETNVHGEENEDMMKKKVRRKKQVHQVSGLRYRGQRDEDEDDEKENRGKGNEEIHTNGSQENKTDIPGKQQTQNQEQENKTNAKEYEASKETETKTVAMSLVNRLWQRPSSVTMSYSQLLSECMAQYDASPSPGTCVRVPPWPVQLQPSQSEAAALEKCLDRLQEGIRKQSGAKDEVNIDVPTLLHAVMEGKDGKEVLEEMTKQVSHAPPSCTSCNSPAPQCEHGDIFSSSSDSDCLTHTLPRAHPPSTYGKNHSASSSSVSIDASPKSNQQHKTSPAEPKDTSTSSTDTKHVSHDRERHISSSSGHKQPLPPTKNTRHPSRQALLLTQKTDPPHSATGARPKEKKGRQTKQGQSRKEGKASEKAVNQCYEDDQHKKVLNEGCQGYGQWVPCDKQESQNNRHTYAGYEDWNEPSQAHNQRCRYQFNEGYNQEYQNDNQGYQEGFQSYNQHYNQEFGGYPGYSQDYNDHHYTGSFSHFYTPLTRTYGQHTHAYIESACKFASMMEYVSTMGRVSMRVAQDYYSRRKQ